MCCPPTRSKPGSPTPAGRPDSVAGATARLGCCRGRGFDALDPKWSGGRPNTISDEVREHICLIARTSPADWKITAFSTWSLSKLANHLVKQKVTSTISRETLRRILHTGKVSPNRHRDLNGAPDHGQRSLRMPWC
ncbi:helix-turn-helix domain-containing protein [Streptomyces albogriseolus]|uniref:helix-turn-helix domain-containing protein n=1 Tax=Streptomyces albogriseolus TaxID=1887 RepID=UPI0036BC6453